LVFCSRLIQALSLVILVRAPPSLPHPQALICIFIIYVCFVRKNCDPREKVELCFNYPSGMVGDEFLAATLALYM
jgi:hypothetical protein